ncbi:MAG TPA: NADH-quinone oxidoreductase subunit J [Tepidisphaeraceae bacterium]|jgi:NADH-quinone oxidoreductase subunit J
MTALFTNALVAESATHTARLISPGILFVLCVVAAVGMIMLLPGGRDTPMRKIGAVILVASLLVLGALLAKTAAGVGAYFWIFSAIALVGAVRVITHTRPVYSALYFVLTVMASAGLFVLMWAEFMAAALVLIYAGAILVTYVFVIMLAAEANSASGTSGAEVALDHDAVSREPKLASAAGFALVGVLLFVIFDKPSALSSAGAASTAAPAAAQIGPAPSKAVSGATQQLGVFLFDKQLINLELAGLILTVAMVGAIIIAKKRVWRSAEDHAEFTETLTAPATPIDDNPHSIPVVGTDNPRQKAYPET